ncbi:54S ribosomal protein L4, mitochondrial isoform X1 [Eucalyptus grandis]|nr:54S ribosomal protein L4, mitochondrial isoform X1 [Eucalyptus grandis]
MSATIFFLLLLLLSKQPAQTVSRTPQLQRSLSSSSVARREFCFAEIKKPSDAIWSRSMLLSRFFGRALFAAARTESSAGTAAAASAATSRTGHNPLEAFFEADRNPENDTPVVYGRSWKAPELRLKSWDDLHKLWYVLLKEKNMLMSQRQMLHAQNLRFPNPERLPKVRKSMCRIKHVLTERAIEEPDPRRSAEMKRMINAL